MSSRVNGSSIKIAYIWVFDSDFIRKECSLYYYWLLHRHICMQQSTSSLHRRMLICYVAFASKIMYSKYKTRIPRTKKISDSAFLEEGNISLVQVYNLFYWKLQFFKLRYGMWMAALHPRNSPDPVPKMIHDVQKNRRRRSGHTNYYQQRHTIILAVLSSVRRILLL